MESATLTRPQPGTGIAARGRAARALPWVRIAFAALCAAVLIGFLAFPTWPNYDSWYMLLWGRELIHGEVPVFGTYRGPTQHPLGILVGAPLSLLGELGARIWVGLCVAGFVALVAGMHRLGRAAFTPAVGLAAAALVLVQFDLAFLAVRGYIDVPYLALVIWAAAVEAQRPRRGTSVLILLALAGLLRPEVWLITLLYMIWCAWPQPWRRRVGTAALAAIGPGLWALSDLLITGDPLYSLTYTSGSADALGRSRALSEIPGLLPGFLGGIITIPGVLLGCAGLVLAVLTAPRRAAVPLVLLVSGVATFALIGAAGLSVITRYLVVAGLALLVFGAVALGGWSMLVAGRWRRGWQAGAALAVVAGVAIFASNVNLTRFQSELVFRGELHANLQTVLDRPATAAALSCGPLTTPNHKLVPEARYVLGLGADQVLARSDPSLRARTAQRRGGALYVTGRTALFRSAITEEADGAMVQVPPTGFSRRTFDTNYAIYSNCGR